MTESVNKVDKAEFTGLKEKVEGIGRQMERLTKTVDDSYDTIKNIETNVALLQSEGDNQNRLQDQEIARLKDEVKEIRTTMEKDKDKKYTLILRIFVPLLLAVIVFIAGQAFGTWKKTTLIDQTGHVSKELVIQLQEIISSNNGDCEE